MIESNDETIEGQEETEMGVSDVVKAMEDQDWSELDFLSALRTDLERLIESVEQTRAQIQIQGRGLTPEEEAYLAATDAALPHLTQALEQVKATNSEV